YGRRRCALGSLWGLTHWGGFQNFFLRGFSPPAPAKKKAGGVLITAPATLAALIGAGGLGEPILSGLNLNDHATILKGAIPAALLALLVQYMFDLLDRVLIPKGLRL